MIKTLTLDGLTSVTIKQSPYDMARFCWVRNRTEADVYISCTDPQCTPNADDVKCISAGECGMLDSESRETLYISGSGVVNIETTPFLVCPFNRGGKGGVSYELPIATTEILGGVMPDGTSITVDENGVISGSSGGSTGGMKLIGSYAVTYSGTATSGNDWSDRIELPIDLYENNRTLLIRTRVDSVTSVNHRLFQNYSMIKIEIPYDIYDTGKYQIIYSPYYQIVNTSDKTAFQLYYYPETNKLSITLCFYVSYLGSTFLDIYDMGVIE